MNILLINHYAGSGKHGMEYRPYFLAREWVTRGNKVTVIAASFSHLHNKRPDVSGAVTEEIIEGIRYLWLRTPAYQGNGVGRLINMFAFSIMLLRKGPKIVSDFKPDVVIASSPHPFIMFGGHKIARSFHAKLVFEVRDLWPLALTELGSMSPRHPFVLLMQKTEDYAYRVADHIVSLLPKAASYMCKRGMAAEKFSYIPNGISAEEWERNSDPIPLHHHEAVERFKKEGRFLVGYAGYFGSANALRTLLEAAMLLKDEPVVFVLVGQGPEKEKLEKMKDRCNLDNVVLLPPVQKSSIPAVLHAMDALYIGWKRNAIYRYGVSPNKLMDYLMAGRPVIHAVEAANDLVAESGCGISVPPEDPGAVAQAVMRLAGMRAEEKEEMGLRGKKYITTHHEYKMLAGKYLEVMSA